MFDFPASPTVGLKYQIAGKSYVWDGEKWRNTPSSMPPAKTAQTRNRIINPSMQVSQENGTAAVTAAGAYPADQWIAGISSSSTISVASAGNNLTLVASPAETSAAAGEYIRVAQPIEGLSLVEFGLGTASSAAFVIAFSVNAPVAGTYWVTLQTPTVSHTYMASYTISAAEVATWVSRTIIVPRGAINAGTWPTNNTQGLSLGFTVHCGSTYVGVAGLQAGNFVAGPGQALGLSTAGAFAITNVGLYLDPDQTGLAPPFQMPAYDDELLRCQRYWWRWAFASASFHFNFSAGAAGPLAWWFATPVTMRTTPTGSSNFAGVILQNCTAPTWDMGSYIGGRLYVSVTAAGSGNMQPAGANHMTLNARM